MTTIDPSHRAVRKDALRNRALLLESAEAMIRERGMDLSLNAVARHAGVGVGTAYRHFPDRDALVAAMFEERVEKLAVIMINHLAAEDPVAGLHAAVFDICEMQAADRGIWEILSIGSSGAHRELVQARVLPLADRLVQRANATGRLRSSFETNDLPVLLWTGGALSAYLGEVSPAAWRRYIQLVLNGYLGDDDPARAALEQRALTIDEIDTAMSIFVTRPRDGKGPGSWPAT